MPGVVGGWSTIISSVNTLIDDLVRPTSEMARVIGAVAKGDLSQTMALEVDGHPLKGQYLRAAMTRTWLAKLGYILAKSAFDRTHLGAKGSAFFSRMVMEELKHAVPETASHFKPESEQQ